MRVIAQDLPAESTLVEKVRHSSILVAKSMVKKVFVCTFFIFGQCCCIISCGFLRKTFAQHIVLIPYIISGNDSKSRMCYSRYAYC